MEIVIRKILCPVDFSESSSHALLYARAFASAHDATLKLLHVIEEPTCFASDDVLYDAESISRLKTACEDELQAVVSQVKTEHEDVSCELSIGQPFSEIVRCARADDVDLIVMGTHGRTGLAHVLIGSVAERVVRKAPCPVLTVKHPEHEFVMP